MACRLRCDHEVPDGHLVALAAPVERAVEDFRFPDWNEVTGDLVRSIASSVLFGPLQRAFVSLAREGKKGDVGRLARLPSADPSDQRIQVGTRPDAVRAAHLHAERAREERRREHGGGCTAVQACTDVDFKDGGSPARYENVRPGRAERVAERSPRPEEPAFVRPSSDVREAVQVTIRATQRMVDLEFLKPRTDIMHQLSCCGTHDKRLQGNIAAALPYAELTR